MAYVPRPGSKIEKAVEYLRARPKGVLGAELAQACGVPRSEFLAAFLKGALEHGLIRRTVVNGRAMYQHRDSKEPLAVPPEVATVREKREFACAMWHDGTIYLEGVEIDKRGGVALTVSQSKVLAELLRGGVYAEAAAS